MCANHFLEEKTNLTLGAVGIFAPASISDVQGFFVIEQVHSILPQYSCQDRTGLGFCQIHADANSLVTSKRRHCTFLLARGVAVAQKSIGAKLVWLGECAWVTENDHHGNIYIGSLFHSNAPDRDIFVKVDALIDRDSWLEPKALQSKTQ